MVESTTETVPATPVAASPKKKTKTPAKGKATAKKASTHPPTASMVNNAIKTLNERGGSSLQAIKKSITATYKLDAEKLAPFIKKYLKSAVEKGTLIRTKGKGAAGSFKLASKAEPKKKTAAPKKKAAPKKEKSADAKPKKAKAAAKKPAAAKKTAKPKAASKPKAATATPKKAPSKVKKTKATPSKKPKTPKPKKTVAKKPKKSITKKA
ncbi:histone H1B-like [Planococcus citri]|uniref:histone H1B-like n=1 Tax=Planococcus citri TaxID=170843 RepID=UPI0031FA41FB